MPRAAEKLFDFPRLYQAKFALTGALLTVVRPMLFRTLVSVPDVVTAAAITPRARICEIGSGDGANYRIVTQIAGDTDYTGIDINPNMVEHCRTTFPDQRWLCANALPYDFKDKHFDFCLIVNVLHHLNSRDDVVRMLAEAGRIAHTVLLFEPLQSESALLSRIKTAYWMLTDGGLCYPRLNDYRSLFASARLRVAWERFSAPLRHFYGAILSAERI